MRLRSMAIIAVSAAAAAVVAVIVFSRVAEQHARGAQVERLVNEGFALLQGESAVDADGALRLALEAQEIDPDNLDALVLQGRALCIKKEYPASIAVFREAMNATSDQELMPELSYHTGLAYLNMFIETGVREDWREAFRNFSDAAVLGAHRVDANIGLGALHATKETFDRDKVTLYWERAIRLERELGGYPGSGADGACPYCRMPFQKKEPTLVEQLQVVNS